MCVKIEEFHRELKQLTGVSGSLCRKARIRTINIACKCFVIFGVASSSGLPYTSGKTIYQISIECQYGEQIWHPLRKSSILDSMTCVSPDSLIRLSPKNQP